MTFKWRKFIRFIHRDFGYFFFGMTIIYSLSGIAINHLNDWNPNYIVNTYEIQLEAPIVKEKVTKEFLKDALSIYHQGDQIKKHYFPNEQTVKIFLKKGNASIDLQTGKGVIEIIKRRQIFNQTTYLHYNPSKAWTWFSDIFAGSLIILAVTGLFMVKGKKGITGRGSWLTALGIIIPLIYLYFIL